MHAQVSRATQQIADCIAACRPELLRSARQLVGFTDAEDLIQSTLERALQHAGTFQPETNMLAWLRRIMSNLTIDSWRRQNRRPTVALDEEREYPTADAGEGRPAWEEITVAQVQAAAAQLPEHFREVFALHSELGLSYTEIARRLQLPIGTVGTRLLRARSQLRASLTQTLAQRAAAASSRQVTMAIATGRVQPMACANDQLATAKKLAPARSRRAGRTLADPRGKATQRSMSGNA